MTSSPATVGVTLPALIEAVVLFALVDLSRAPLVATLDHSLTSAIWTLVFSLPEPLKFTVIAVDPLVPDELSPYQISASPFAVEPVDVALAQVTPPPVTEPTMSWLEL